MSSAVALSSRNALGADPAIQRPVTRTLEGLDEPATDNER